MAWENGIQVPFPLFFFAWHWKTDLNFVFRFSFSHHFEKRKRVSFWFRFSFSHHFENGFEFRFSFSHYFEKRIWISFLVFASLWKTDLNFVFRFCMACYWKIDLNFVCHFSMTWKTDYCTGPVIWSPRTSPQGWPGHSLFMQVKASEFFSPRGRSEWWTPPAHTVLPFLTLKWMTNDMMIAAKKHAAIATLAYPRWRRKMTNIWTLYNLKSQNAR